MKMNRLFMSFLALPIASVMCMGCKDKDEDPAIVNSIDCIQDGILLYKGHTTSVDVSVLPENAEDKSYYWEVKDESIAKVQDANSFIGVGVGETWAYVISSSRPEIKDSLKITVEQMELKSIPVTDENIHYEGRVAISDSEVQFLYPGTSFTVNFTGSTLYAEFNKVVAYYWVEIDDQEPYKLYTRSKKNWVSDNIFKIADGLAEGLHTAKITLCSEGIYKNPKFYGFQIEKDAELSEVATKPVKFEFIGNSITCGYGTEVTNRSAFNDSTSNFCHTYAYTITKEFNAEIMVVARSGIGVYRNYGDTETASSYGSMPNNYEKNWLESTENWDFSKFTPDVLFINLGTNDTWDMTTFSEEKYETEYRALLDKVISHYPNVKLVLLTGSMMANPALSTIKSILDKVQADYNTDAHPCYRFDFTPTSGTGADWHPCAAQQAQMGADLSTFLKENNIVK